MSVLTSTWFLTALVMIVGAVLITFAAWKLQTSETAHDIVRDLGIACLVAGLITIFYDQIIHLRKLSDAVGLVVGANVPPQILNAANNQIFQREVIRENLELRWTIQQESSLPPDQAIIKARISYDMYGMRPEPFDFQVVQELENQNVQNAAGTIPHFDSVTVGSKTYKDDELKAMVKDGTITLPRVKVYPWKGLENVGSTPSIPVHLIFERTELIYLPGSYSTVLSQTTHGVKLEVDVPPDMKHTLKEWFERGGQHFEAIGDKEYSFNDFVLAGQSVSVQFTRSGQSPKLSTRAMPQN